MARSDYIVRIKGDLSQFKSEVAEAKGEIQRLNDDEVLIRLDFKDGDVAALQKVIDSIIKSDPTLTVQLNYDLQTRSLQDKLKEQQRLLDLSHMLSGQLDGSNDIERAVKTIVEEVNDGLDKGIKKTDLQEKLKKAINLSDSYTEATGKQLSESVLSRLEEVRAKFPRLENYEGDFSYFDKLDERMKSNKVIIDGLQESLKQLQQKGAVRTDKIIDLHNLEEGAEYADKLLDKAEDAKKRLETSTGSRKITYFDGFKEQIYDTISDAEKLDALLDELASKWGEVGFRAATDYVNKNGRVTDNLYDQLQSGYDEPSLGSWTYFTQNYNDLLDWRPEDSRKIFAANLEGIEKLLRAESDKYMDDFNNMFSSMHALIARDIFPNDHYDDILDNDDVKDIQSLYARYQQQFEDFGVTQEKLSQFIKSQTEWLSQFNSSSGNIPEELKTSEAFASKFIKEVLGFNGVSTSNLGSMDSTYLGTGILDSIAEQIPHIDFGDNREISQKFAEKVFGNIIKNKAKNPNVDLDEVLRMYTGVDLKTFKTGDINKMAQTSIYDIDAFKKMYQNYQDALEIQKEIKNLRAQQTELPEQETKETDSDSMRKDTEQTEKNTEAHRENAKAKEESSEAGSGSSSSTEQTSKDTEETDKNTQAHKENEQAKEQSSKAGSSSTSDSAEQTQKDTEETERNTKAHKENEQAKKDAAQASSGDNSYEDSTNNIDDEIAALGRLKSAAEEAAAAKQAVRAANEGLGGSAEETSSDLGKEAQAMNDVSSSGDKASNSKEDVKTANEKLGSSADTSSGKLDNEAESINGVDEEAKKIKENTERYYKLLNDAFDVRNFVQGDADLTRMFGDDNAGIIGALNDMFSSPEEAFTANGKQYLDDLEIFVSTVKNSVHEAATGMDSDIDAFTKAMGTLYSGKNDYLKNLRTQATSKDGFDSIGKQISDYEAGIKSVSNLIDSMKAKWGENSDIVSNATKAFAKYQQDTTANMAQDIAKQAQQQIDKIDRAMKTRGEQGSGFMAEYAQRLDEAKTNAQGIVEALAHGTPPPDSGDWKTWLSTLESGKNTLKEINDQSNLLATQNQLSKLLTKVNQDIEKGAQYGQLGDSYAKLKSDVEGALSSLKSANDAGEALSKIDFRNFADAYQQLHATGVEIGAFKGTFLSKFSDAITNQSAQFLATYFSFQDMIRYGKEVVNTVVQTDSALTELKKVSDASNERIQQSFQTSAETAQELGSTITDVINSTSDWARMGYSIDEAEKLSRVTTLFQTVGDNMTRETASESLVSILQGFNIDAKDSERVLDSINEVSNNFAIDTRGGLSCPVTWKHVA